MADVSIPAGDVVAQVPEGLSSWLDLLTVGVLLLAAAWAILALIGWYQRRAYNLTVVDDARAQRTQADFLQVDHAAREAALARGDAYIEQRTRDTVGGEAPAAPLEPGAKAAAPGGVGRMSQVARIGAVLFAMVNVVVVGAGALMRAESTHQFFAQLSHWERWKVLLGNYWIGFVVAVLVILLQLFYLGRAIVRARRA